MTKMTLIDDKHGNIGCGVMIVGTGLAIAFIILAIGGCTALSRSYIQYSTHDAPKELVPE